MIIESRKTFVMFRIKSPSGISFYKEHQDLIQKNGYVWFCRFGNSNLIQKSINKDGNIIFVKESVSNGGKRYVLTFTEMTKSAPTSGYPAYYDSITLTPFLWFKVTSITELPANFESCFSAANSNNSLERIYGSICNTFYIRSRKTLEI